MEAANGHAAVVEEPAKGKRKRPLSPQPIEPPSLDDMTPPHDPRAERELIGCILLLGKESFDYSEVQRVKPYTLFDDSHRVIFNAAASLAVAGKSVTPITVAAELRRLNTIEAAGGEDYVHRVWQETVNASSIRYVADIVCERYAARKQWEFTRELADQVRRGASPQYVRELLTTFAAVSDSSEAAEIQLLSAAELDAGEFTTAYHVHGIVAKKQPLIVSAAPKCLKTNLICIDMGLSIATGRPFLGQFETERANVLVLSGESGLGALQDCARRVAYSKGFPLSTAKGFSLATWLPRFDDPASLAELGRLIDRAEAEIVFVDPAYLAMSGEDAGNLMTMGAQLRGPKELIESKGATLGLIHHMKKTTGREPGALPELSDIAWSGFAEFGRQWVLLSRRQPYQPGTGHHELWMSVGGSAGHNGAWALDVDEGVLGDRYWATKLRSMGDAMREAAEAAETHKAERKDRATAAAEKRLQDAALEALTNHGAMTLTSLSKAISRSGKLTRAAVEGLIEDGRAAPCKVGVYDGFEATQTNPDKPRQSGVV